MLRYDKHGVCEYFPLVHWTDSCIINMEYLNISACSLDRLMHSKHRVFEYFRLVHRTDSCPLRAVS